MFHQGSERREKLSCFNHVLSGHKLQVMNFLLIGIGHEKQVIICSDWRKNLILYTPTSYALFILVLFVILWKTEAQRSLKQCK